MTHDLSPSAKSPANKAKRRWAMVLGSLAVLGISLLIRYYWGLESASADPAARQLQATRPTTAQPAPKAAPRPAATTATQPMATDEPRVVARVNNRQISRDELARECLRHYGEQVLESLLNKYLIMQECQRRNLQISQAEIDAEIEQMAARFQLSKEQWLKMLEQERGIKPPEYAEDIIWPTLALRKLAGQRLEVTPAELRRAYEMKYGPSVKARLIACSDRAKAEKVRAMAAADPRQFGDLAKNYSEDPSASLKGRIQPIRKHGSYEQIEEAVFSMRDGEVSPVIEAGGQFVIVQREELLPGSSAVNFQQVAPQLKEMVRDTKLRKVSGEIFQQLQDEAVVRNVLNAPKLSRQMPGVAATINGQPISTSYLAEECLKRHGTEVLDGTINRKLIEIACEKRGIQVTDAEIDQEIARAAALSVPTKPDGSPDVAAWIKLVTEEQGITEEIYRRDSVWPSVALKKLVGEKVDVSDEDMRKGYEANFGPRVRCLAIVTDNLRRAQRVWDMARNNPTPEYFGQLAEQYSVEASSRALRGEVPPIKKNGGQPLLEKEAFGLKQGELSSVVQVGDRYVILYCLGYTEPTDVRFEQVRDIIHADIHEKKLRQAMAGYFEKLQDSATIDNFLTGTTQRPQSSSTESSAAGSMTLRQVPARR